jgi:hypothetical protein
MNGKIIIIDDVDFIKNNLDKIKEMILEEKAPVVPLSDAAYLLLTSEGIDCIDYRKFERDNTYDNLYSTARQWGMNWYKPGGADFTNVGSYSLGNIIEWGMIYYFSQVLRIYLSVWEIVKNMKPKEILYISAQVEDNKNYALKSRYVDNGSIGHVLNNCIIAADPSIKLSMRELPYSSRVQKNELNWLRQIFFYFNIPFSFMLRMLNSALKKRKRIIFFEGFRHFYQIFNHSQLKEFEIIHLQKNIGPSLFFKLFSKGIRIESFNYATFARDKNDPPGVEHASGELLDFFMYRDHDLFPCVWPTIQLILKEHMSLIWQDVLRAMEIMKRIKPSCLVTENDSTYYEKLLVTVAKKMNIYTIVIQNGATIFSDSHIEKEPVVHDFYPLIADRFFSFGKISKDWFINMSADERKVIITGGPRFDDYYKMKKTRGKDAGSNKTVLFLLQDLWHFEGVVNAHIRLYVQYKHITEFIKLAKKNTGFNFIIRPHSNDHLWGKIFQQDLIGLNNLTISREGSMEDVLSKACIVIGYTSTALIEALIMRIPVISLDTGEFCNFFQLWKYGLSKRVSSFEELGTEIKKLAPYGNERMMAMDSIEKNVHLFNYGDDGKASERVVVALKEIVRSI